jgi:hypothetical protein
MVTFDITPQNLGSIKPDQLTVRVYREVDGGLEEIGEGQVGYPTFERVPRARLVWTWNTTGLEGPQNLVAWLDPDDVIQEGDAIQENNAAAWTVEILPPSERPPAEIGATWVTTHTACCTFHYLTGTAAERDLETLLDLTEDAITHVETVLHEELEENFEVYFLSRVVGHGGYANGWLAVSYLDRHYAADDMENVLRHEAAHALDTAELARYAPALAREGLAVMAAGGHFKPDPIPERAAALLELDWYIPLEVLADDFYRHQHEIGYLEAGALITYLIEIHGWESFRDFYTSFEEFGGTQPEMLDQALEAAFGTDLQETEADFLDWLASQEVRPEHVRDLEGTVRFFEAVRRYQELYVPSAYFRTGWLPNPDVGASRGIVASFVRHPSAPEHVALETMFVAARRALEAGAYDRLEMLLDTIERVLDEGAFADPPAADYLAIAVLLEGQGYEVQTIDLWGDRATVEAIVDWPELIELEIARTADGWAVGK